MEISRGSHSGSDGNYNEQRTHQFCRSQDNLSTGINLRTTSPLQSSKSLAPSFENGDGGVRGSVYGRCGVGNIEASRDEDTICSLINQKMGERTGNLISVMKGITRRMAQLDMITSRVEDSIDSLNDSTEYYHGRNHVKLKEIENMISEIQGGILELRDKREIAETQLRLAKLQTLGDDTRSEIRNKSPQKVAVRPALSSPLQDQQPVVCPQQSPYFTSNVSPNPPPQNILHSPASTTVDLSYQSQANEYLPIDQSQRFTPVLFANPAYQYPISQASLAPIATVHNASLDQQFLSSAQLSSVNMYSSGHPRTHSSNQSHQQISFVDPEAHVSSISSSFIPDQAAYNQPSNNSFPNFSSEHALAPGNSGHAHNFTGSASRFADYVRESSQHHPSSSFPRDDCSYSSLPTGKELPRALPMALSVSAPRESSQHHPSSSSAWDDSSYSSLPTGKELPRALPMALSIDAPTGTQGNESSLGRDDVVDKVVAMGFRRDIVRATVRKLAEDGASVDPNIVLDVLTTDSIYQ